MKIRHFIFVVWTLFGTIIGSMALDIHACGLAVGLESGRVTDEQLSASSSFDQLSTGPANARVRSELGGGAWCPAAQINASAHEWVQVDLGEPHFLTAVETQGRWDGGRGREFPGAYMLEYWRDSLGRWARYRDIHTNEIIDGNVDTRTAVVRALDGGVVARLVRLIPVSETTRTVCMRFEIYGCAYKDHLSSYSMEDGVQFDGLDLRDNTYDGTSMSLETGATWLSGGLGRLFDGVVGIDNFELRPAGWVGWRRQNGNTNRVTLDFQLSSRRNVSALMLHTSNFRRLGARVFSSAQLYFAATEPSSADGVAEFSSRFIDFAHSPDDTVDAARWVRVAITPARSATRVRVILDFADDAQWILLSEVRLEYGSVTLDTPWPADDPWRSNNTSDISYFAVIEQDNTPASGIAFPWNARCFFVGALFLGGIAVSIATFSVFYCIFMVYRRNAQLDKHPQFSNLHNSKSLIRVILEDSKHTTKSSKIRHSHDRSQVTRLNEKILPDDCWAKNTPYDNHKSSFSSTCSSNEYAEADITDIADGCLLRPLLKHNSASTHRYQKGCHTVSHFCCDDTTAANTSCYDLNCQQSMTASSSTAAGSVRYRTTPCASTFGCAERSPNNVGNATGYSIDSATLHSPFGDDENAYAMNEDYPSVPMTSHNNADGTLRVGTNFPSDNSIVLPDFNASALHAVKRLGVTANNHNIDVCRMDADRLVSVISMSDEANVNDFHDEMQRLAQLRHFNVIRVIGTCSQSVPAYIFEFMPNGDLHQFLKSRVTTVSDEALISFATQISAGMAFLESCGFTHGNLMARNCFIDTAGGVKIGFETLRSYRSTLDDAAFVKVSNVGSSDAIIPIRWYAWEVLTRGQRSIHADVWAFGVTMWELFTECLERPYPNLSDEQLLENVQRISQKHLTGSNVENESIQTLLTIPNRCSQFIYDQLVVPCWRIEPDERPSFAELHRILQSLALSNIAQKMLNSRNLLSK